MGIVESAPFQMRTKLEAAEAARLEPAQTAKAPAGTAKVVGSNSISGSNVAGTK
jgi:hypothetical protein